MDRNPADGGDDPAASSDLKRPAHAPLDPELRHFIRTLRANQTDPERFLWQILRGRRFAGAKFRRQFPVDRFILDFYCHEVQLAIERDGGQHNAPESRENDESRTLILARRGIRVLRFWNEEVFKETESILEAIGFAIEEARVRRESSGPQEPP